MEPLDKITACPGWTLQEMCPGVLEGGEEAWGVGGLACIPSACLLTQWGSSSLQQ